MIDTKPDKMYINGYITLKLDKWTSRELIDADLYDLCKSDLKWVCHELPVESLFKDFDEVKERLFGDEIEDLCDYILDKWVIHPPKIENVYFESARSSWDGEECFIDTVYEVDCDWNLMYKNFKEDTDKAIDYFVNQVKGD